MTTKELTIASIEAMTAVELFKEDRIGPILNAIKKEVSAEVLDASTDKGRERIKSLAYKVAKTKTKLDSVGKDLVSGWKKQASEVDALRKKARDNLDALKEEVRRPVTEWEQAEEARVTGFSDRIAAIDSLAYGGADDSEALKVRLTSVEQITIDSSWDEFESLAQQAKDKALAELTVAISAAEKAEAEQLELERLRREDAERKEQERIDLIAKEAAAEAELKLIEQKRKAEQERQEAIKRQEALEKKAEEEKAQAERDRVAAEERHKKEVIAAAEAEKQRIEQERVDAENETKRREENKEHCRKINSAAKECLVTGGLTEDHAELAVKLIAQGMVANVAIKY